MTIKQQLVSSRAKTYAGTNGRRYITIHETANTDRGAGAQRHANLQSNGFSSSWHWQVDDKVAIQSFPHTVRCWHAGDGKGTGNYHSIGIEICVNVDSDFQQAVKNAAELVKKIMREEGIPLSNVVQHNHWSGKNCPTNLRNGSKGISWHRFISMVSGASGTASSGAYHLEYGDVGDKVRKYQEDLKQAGYAIEVDGSFGPAMLVTVKKFQRDHGLTVDGLLGPGTQKKLDEVLSARKETPKKEVDEMAQRLPETQRNDMKTLLSKAYKDKVFHVDHTSKVDTMTRGQATDLMISYVARTSK